MSLVVPAVLPSSRTDLEEKLARFAAIPKVGRVQIDVVDGKFAAPASWPYSAPGELEAMVTAGEILPQQNAFSYEIDLMCADAEHAIGMWIKLGASRFTLHVESAPDFPQLLAAIHRRYGNGDLDSDLLSFGLALSIGSDLSRLEPHLKDVEYVQFMGIATIGRQGEPFDDRVFEQIRIFRERHPDVPIQVDGGVTLEKAKKLVGLGVTNLVVGSGILKASDPIATFNALDELESPFGV